MPIVLSTHPLHPRAAAMLEGEADLRIAPSLEPNALMEAARDAAVIIVRAPIPAALFENAPRLRAAIRHGAGVDMIPIEAATKAGVLVANVPGANARSVAEYVVLSMLALARRFRAVDRDLRTNGWSTAREHATQTHEITGKTLGLIGFGNVGRQIHHLAQAFDMRVMTYKPSPEKVPMGVERLALDEVIGHSDFLVLCCPLNKETRGIINSPRLARMKPTAFLINAARGAVINEDDLLSALQAGRVAGAALDVFTRQPLTKPHRLFEHENVILTPHVAGITDESMERMGVGALHETLRVLRGELPANWINPEVVAAYQSRFARNSSSPQ